MSLGDRVRSAAVLAFTLALWAALAPVAVGGSSTYVMVAGASMQPSLETGDLVVARQAPRYGVGDIVAYQHPRLGPIIHRISDSQGGHFVLQGDNNPWPSAEFTERLPAIPIPTLKPSKGAKAFRSCAHPSRPALESRLPTGSRRMRGSSPAAPISCAALQLSVDPAPGWNM